MNSISIGFFRDDGDFAILATLNNNDNHMTTEVFSDMAETLCKKLILLTNETILIIAREDVPDYVTI